MTTNTAAGGKKAGNGGIRNFRGQAFDSYEISDSGTSMGMPRSVGRKAFNTAQFQCKGPKGDVYSGTPIGERRSVFFVVS